MWISSFLLKRNDPGVLGLDSTKDDAEDGERDIRGCCGDVWTNELLRDIGQWDDAEDEMEKADVRHVDGVRMA